MNIPLKYEDVVAKMDAALAREAALREELNQYEPVSPGTASKRARWLLNIQDACKYGLPKHLVQRLNNTTKEIQNSIKFGGKKRLRDENESLQQRLTVAEQRAGELEQMLADVPQIHFEGCDFQGFNPDGSEPFEFTDDPVKKIKSIRLIGWRCDGPITAEEGITVKDQLAIAEKELADLQAEIKAAGKPPHTDYWHQSLYYAKKKVADARAALKPAEDYNELDDDEDLEVFDDQ